MRQGLKLLFPSLAAAACLAGCTAKNVPATTPAPAPSATGGALAPENGAAGSPAENAARGIDRMERGIGDAMLDLGERMGAGGKS